MTILLRADSGFARDELMSWCEATPVDYVFGLARNRAWSRRDRRRARRRPRPRAGPTGGPARRFKEFRWRTHDSWSRRAAGDRQGRAWTHGGPNPRFIVTSLDAADDDARRLYEDVYCARGEMENRIKECQLDLFADRTSAATMRANQLRLWFASMAYVLLVRAAPDRPPAHPVRRAPPAARSASSCSRSAPWSALSCRRIKLAMASAFPCQAEYALAHLRLTAAC